MTILDGGGAETDTAVDTTGAAPAAEPPPFAPVLRLAAPPPSPPRPPVVGPRPAGGMPLPPGVTPAMAEAMTRLAVEEAAKVRRRTRRRAQSRTLDLVRALVVGLALTAWLAHRFEAVTWLLRQTADEDATPQATASTWDPRVSDLVMFVQAERGLAFDHPVPVDFLPEDEFTALFAVATSTTPVSPEEAAAERAGAAWYDDLGLAVAYSPIDGEADLDATATLGFYSPYDDRVFVRGEQLTAAVRTVLVHELTHALQAQHFTLALGGEDDLTVRSLAEADAMRVEEAYLATLPQSDQDAARAANTLDADDEAQLGAIPWAVVQAQYAPYVIGPGLVAAAYRSGGNPAVDALLAHPPTEEILISPWLKNVPQTEVDPPVSVPRGATVVVPEERLSMFDVLVMLDAWLSWTQARGALDGWAGGRVVMYELAEGGPICVGATIAYDGPPVAMSDALVAWAAAAGSSLVPVVTDHQVSFEACPRGPGATAPPEPVVPPIQAIDLEHAALDDLDAAVSPDEVARRTCYARMLIDDQALAPLMLEAELDADEQAIVDWVTTAAADTCGLAPS